MSSCSAAELNFPDGTFSAAGFATEDLRVTMDWERSSFRSYITTQELQRRRGASFPRNQKSFLYSYTFQFLLSGRPDASPSFFLSFFGNMKMDFIFVGEKTTAIYSFFLQIFPLSPFLPDIGSVAFHLHWVSCPPERGNTGHARAQSCLVLPGTFGKRRARTLWFI